MEEPSNGGMLYHEVQESKLCAMHCVNTVLQGPFFSEFDLAALASDLDHKERQMLGGQTDFLPDEDSHNVSMDGYFSIQVLQKALEVWDLQLIPLDSPLVESAQIDPQLENAFVCHLQDHWFCIRKVNGEWFNFDSLYAAPEHLSKFYLSAYLDTLRGFGWTIFLVRGNFPRECPMTNSEASNSYGQWLTPEDADRIFKACNSPQRGRGRVPFLTSSSSVGGGNLTAQVVYEDEDLRAAIAASLMDSLPETASSEAEAKAVSGEAAAKAVSCLENENKNKSGESENEKGSGESENKKGSGESKNNKGSAENENKNESGESENKKGSGESENKNSGSGDNA